MTLVDPYRTSLMDVTVSSKWCGSSVVQFVSNSWVLISL